ncbi:MAG: hypothetical protein U1D67_08710 [Dehalococcoidia bacterium]|nr:hypothetical protein [Dehalococcoidia bacterium]
MPFLKNLLLNRNFILITSVVLGLTAGRFASLTQPLILPVMALVMTLSTASVTTRDLKSLKTNPGPILVSLVLGSFVTSGIIILLANWLIDDREMWTGFILIAAVPPAVAVVPYTFILGGDMCLSLLGMIAGYLAALVLTPAIIVLFLGVDSFNPVQLVVMLLELIVIPLVASRILLVTGINSRIEKWRGTIINWSFFIVLFTIIGLNRQVFFSAVRRPGSDCDNSRRHNLYPGTRNRIIFQAPPRKTTDNHKPHTFSYHEKLWPRRRHCLNPVQSPGVGSRLCLYHLRRLPYDMVYISLQKTNLILT